jgi:hypothetical protein
MFCKVCKDAGKSEIQYTSHWVRNVSGPSGKVVCPTLLSQKCKYCKEQGHTPKHCPKLEVKNKQQNQSTHSHSYKLSQRSRELCSSPPPVPFKEQHLVQRARQLCYSPPPPPAPSNPKVITFHSTPVGKKTNYFQLLTVEEAETKDAETKDAETKDAENYKKNLEKNFPTLGQEKTMKIVNAIFPKQTYCSMVSVTTKKNTTQNKRDDSPTPTPTPSPMASRPNTPPMAPKKLPTVKEEEEAVPMTTSWADMD